MSDDIEVVGGAYGIEADFDDMHAAGTRIQSLGQDVAEVALTTHGFLADPNLLASAALAPGSFAEFETTLLGALDGPDGVSVNAARMVAAGMLMQAAARAYYAVDQSLEVTAEVCQHAQGWAYGVSLAVNPVGTAGATGAYLWASGAFSDPRAWLVGHPDLVEQVIGSAPGLLDLFMPGVGYPATVEQASGLLASLYVQQAAPPAITHAEQTQAPENLAEAMLILDETAENENSFRIERVGTGEDAVLNIYLSGTKDFNLPWEAADTVQNMGTNFAGVAGTANAYSASVVMALRQLREKGVPVKDMPINVMGHSQGGIIAARLADRMSNPDSSVAGYNVQTVVTAGSPVDHIELPEQVQMVSLVNEYDLVPRLDGEAYEDQSNHTTIIIEEQTGTVIGNHDMRELYVPMSEQLVASEDAEVRAALDPLADFYPGGGSTTWTFEMDRR